MSNRLSPSDFLSSLTTLLSSSHSSIYLTQKPLSSSSSSSASASESAPPQVLIRATNGYHIPNAKTRIAKHLLPLRKPGDKRVKISTAVDVGDIEEFYAKYAEVCKKGMEGLKKRDKKKAKAKAKKKHQQQQKQQ